jgi:hypothetical protein
MKNLLINYLSGDKIFEKVDLDIYFKHLRKLKNVDKIVLVDKVSDYNIKTLEQIYDKIIPTNYAFYYIFYAFFEVLMNYGQDYDYALYSDTRDVIFQKNPFDYMQSKPDKSIFLACEGMEVWESEGNRIWHDTLVETQKFRIEDSDKAFVVNGGTMGGRVKDMIYAYMLAISNTNRNHDQVIPDQAIFTHMYLFLKHFKFADICHPYTSDYCATGEGIKRGHVNITFKNNQACNEAGEPYYIFHQWDRTEFADQIRDQHNNTLSFVL